MQIEIDGYWNWGSCFPQYHNMQVKMKKSKGESRRDISTAVSNKPLSKFQFPFSITYCQAELCVLGAIPGEDVEHFCPLHLGLGVTKKNNSQGGARLHSQGRDSNMTFRKQQ